MTAKEQKEYFIKEVARIINNCSLENMSNTPDFVLATALWYEFETLNFIINRRETWYGRQIKSPGDSGPTGPIPPAG